MKSGKWKIKRPICPKPKPPPFCSATAPFTIEKGVWICSKKKDDYFCYAHCDHFLGPPKKKVG